MVCLGLKPGAAGWKAQTNPLSYGGTLLYILVMASAAELQVNHCLLASSKNLSMTQMHNRGAQ